MESMRPVFIGGCPRSGTTFLGSLLGGHSRIICVPESEFIGMASRLVSSDENIDNDALRCVLHHWRFRYWGLDRKRVISGMRDDNTLRDFIETIISDYSGQRRKETIDIWIDHTPNNLHFLPTLFRHFPEGLAIHIIRDARAVAASIMPLDWGPNTSRDAADLWVRETGIGLAAREWLPDRIMNIHYESLVMDTESQLKMICDFIDIPYESVLIENAGFSVPRYSRKQHALVGKAPDRTRIDAWKTRLKGRDVEIIESRARSMMAYLGYTELIHDKPRPIRLSEKMMFGLRDAMWRRWIHRIRLNRRRRE